MSRQDRLSVNMRHALYLFAHQPTGFVPASDLLLDSRSAAALERRQLVRAVELNGVSGWCLSPEGASFVSTRWPSSPYVLGTTEEPEGGWTPEQGVRR